jgi:putative colanic acid biosynthesis UDP-glucose lipid carrier transferase
MIVDQSFIYSDDKIIRFYLVANIGWLLIAYALGLYKVYRFTKIVKIIRDSLNQLIVFFFLFSSLYAWSYLLMNQEGIINFFIVLSLVLLLLKTLHFILLRKYRRLGKNYRNVIIVGYDESAKYLYRFFTGRREYGYNFNGFFSDKAPSKLVTGRVKDVADFCAENEIDEIYCATEELSDSCVKWLIDYADNNLKVIKFIPASKGVYNRKLTTQFYDIMPVFSLRDNPFDDFILKAFKRIFDIVFSFLVIALVLSWLVPIIGFLIKRESPGPIFFKQKRSGLNNEDFWVYKFRSMGVNRESDKLQATKNDPRVTKIGAFMRKTSIDELPQFFNVFFGDMSVVGPRPHMLSHTEYYSSRIDKYMVRHMVKPGITGLAQVRGFRGETETILEMKSRARVDRFYIENWSMLLDIKIIIQTVVNALNGEEKAY